MRHPAILGVLVVLIGACGRSPYAGYKAVGGDVHLRLLALGDGEDLPADSDSVVMRLRLGHHGGEAGDLFSTERTYLVKDIRSGALKPVLRRLHVGDSLSVIAPGTSWPWEVITEGMEVEVPRTVMVQGEIVLRALRTPAMMRAEAERWKRDDPLGYERRLIAAFMARDQRNFVQWGTSDVYYTITGVPKDTNAVVAGTNVTIAYSGIGLEDGRVFDDTRRNGAPFSFIFGDQGQVMNGLEVAVSLLREGQEGTFIFPSMYAFGAKGIPGVLEPHMPVSYTVKLLRVDRATAMKPS